MSRRPTICQVLHSLHVGGAEVLAARMARGLGSDFRFVFACLDDLGPLGEALRADGIPVAILDRRPGLDRRCISRLTSLLRLERADLVHCHQYSPFFYGAMARGFRRRPALLFTEHGRHFPDSPRPKRILANRLLLGRRDRVVGVGQAVKTALVRNEGIPASRVSVVYNGVDLAPFSEASGDGDPGGREAIRAELGLGSDDLVILMVARLDPLKDHATALRAIARVAAIRGETRLIVVGEGPERAPILAEIQRLELVDRVFLLGQRPDVPRLLRAADLLILTSMSEGIPLTIIEAMASGLPVVATRVGGVGEVVEDGETGLLVEPGDDRALALAISRLAADPERRQRMGACGIDRAADRFSEERMLGHYRQLYEEMLRG